MKRDGKRRTLYALAITVWMVVGVSAWAEEPLVFDGEYIIERDAQIAAAQQSSDLRTVARASHSELVALGPAIAAAQSDGPKAKRAYSASLDRCAELRRADPSIRSCSPNYVRRPSEISNDQYAAVQWYLQGPAEERPFGIAATSAWPFTHGSRSVVVGVLDTGIDYNHPDLAANVWTNPGEIPGNGIDDDGNGYKDDVHGANIANNNGNPIDQGGANSTFRGHGTHVSGIIGAVGNNGIGVSGVNWEVSLIGVTIYRQNLDDSSAFDIIKGFDYLSDLKLNRNIPVTAVNASFGGAGFSQPEYAAILRARDAGILVIAAAGNEGSDNDRDPIYPASYNLDNIISVAATDDSGELAYFSNYGAKTVDIAAPGTSIYSTIPGGAYDYKQGTSMAAPIVTGAIALLQSLNPGLNYLELKKALLDGAVALDGLRTSSKSGKLLNLASIVGAQDVAPQATPPPQPGRFKLRVRGFSRQRRVRITVTRTDFISARIPAKATIGVYLNGNRCSGALSLNDTRTKKTRVQTELRGLTSGVNTFVFYVTNSAGTITDTERFVQKVVAGKRYGASIASKKYTDVICSGLVNSAKILGR